MYLHKSPIWLRNGMHMLRPMSRLTSTSRIFSGSTLIGDHSAWYPAKRRGSPSYHLAISPSPLSSLRKVRCGSVTAVTLDYSGRHIRTDCAGIGQVAYYFVLQLASEQCELRMEARRLYKAGRTCFHVCLLFSPYFAGNFPQSHWTRLITLSCRHPENACLPINFHMHQENSI